MSQNFNVLVSYDRMKSIISRWKASKHSPYVRKKIHTIVRACKAYQLWCDVVHFNCSVMSNSFQPHGLQGFPVLHCLLELAETHVHRVGDAIQPPHPLSSPSPPAFNLSQHQALFQWVGSSHQVAKVLEFQLQKQSFQWIISVDFL